MFCLFRISRPSTDDSRAEDDVWMIDHRVEVNNVTESRLVQVVGQPKRNLCVSVVSLFNFLSNGKKLRPSGNCVENWPPFSSVSHHKTRIYIASHGNRTA